MPICKCGRNIPDNAICFCSETENSVVVYTNTEINIPEISKVEHQDAIFTSSTMEYTRSLWKALHTYKYINKEETEKWFKEWLKKIPCGDCKTHFARILEDFPTDFSSNKSFFVWGVDIHNKVNERLQKLKISLEEAILLWDFKNL